TVVVEPLDDSSRERGRGSFLQWTNIARFVRVLERLAEFILSAERRQGSHERAEQGDVLLCAGAAVDHPGLDELPVLELQILVVRVPRPLADVVRPRLSSRNDDVVREPIGKDRPFTGDRALALHGDQEELTVLKSPSANRYAGAVNERLHV